MRVFLRKKQFLPVLIIWLAMPGLNAMAETALPFKSDETDFPVQGQLAIIVLGIVLLFLFCLIGWKRKRGSAQASRWLSWLPAQQDEDGLKVLNSKRIAGNTSVHVVEWDGGKVLFAVSEHGVVRLGEMSSSANTDKNRTPPGDAS